ncbi:MAG: ATP-binding cassette domain-containing protein [Planctomycetes bacterium]|nr:ATP-binding cassette domain-containing protein [Planctomycetota bacterium]
MIEVKGITKFYGHFKALDGVSFHVDKGEVLGFLGPNGAGKSTTMKILTTYISASEGTASVGGHDVHAFPQQVRRRIGYLPETPPLYGDMTVEDYLKFAGRARGLQGAELKRRLESVVTDCGLRPKFKARVVELSKGFKQRTGLAQALIHDPDVLILDEPTSGLDPRQIIEIRKLIERLRENKCIIFSTHILQEATAVASRLVIVNGGRKVADGTVEQLAAQSSDTLTVRVLVKGGDDALSESLSRLDTVKSVEKQQGPSGYTRYLLTVSGGQRGSREACEAVALQVQSRGFLLAELAPEKLTLEHIFLNLLQKAPMPAMPAKPTWKADEKPVSISSTDKSALLPLRAPSAVPDDPNATAAATRLTQPATETDLYHPADANSDTATDMGEKPDPDKTLFSPRPPDRGDA